jgi:long-chain acyl-CoA synthetase
MNPAVWVQRHGRLRPDAPAIADGERVHATWAQFAARTAEIAGALRRDLAPGDRVAVFMPNRVEYLEALFGIWHAGLVAVPINARLHPDELAYIAHDSGSQRVLTGEETFEADPIALTDRAPDDPAWLFYTSGTTGRPKGATLTTRNLLMMTLSYYADIDPIAPTDAVLHVAPLSHGSGLYGLPHVARGAVSVIGDDVPALTRRWPGSSFFAAPTMVNRLAADPAMADAPFKTIIYGGAPMYLADLQRALDAFGPRLAQIYGQGETPMTITALSQQDHADGVGLESVGTPRTDVEVRVAEDGEILVRGDVVMAGYWNQPEATAETLRDGWLHTGDIGSFDERGYLTLHDRSKDLIISGGMNIYPREVEEALLHHERVQAVAVVGKPDPEWGETVVAFVVGDAPADELDRTCLDRIARYKRPREYRFVDALPTNHYGKVVKRELRDRL